MDSRSILDRLLKDGWIEIRQRGSSLQLRHPTKPGLVTLPHPRRDVPVGALRSIDKQAGLKLRRES
ncbi:type II toxin-antitoxin system HicA family toxin [Jiella sp. M17.18]|uniref:type II toxin-antitoxin system HicA family toxin n=1 Tax=Jiella sp. M17.18 TaxID=3234247 RepID=UPI0034E023CD